MPNHLKDPSRDAEAVGHGEGYAYPHEFPGHWVAQQYLPDGLQGTHWYRPGDLGYERVIKEQMEKRQQEGRAKAGEQ